MKNSIEQYIQEAQEITDEWQIERWHFKVKAYLREAFGTTEEIAFNIKATPGNWFNGFSSQIGYLEAFNDKNSVGLATNESVSLAENRNENLQREKKVFVVHGHDNEAKESLSRFIEKVGLKAVVLHEQPSQGMTIIEKFEKYSDVLFAVVILSPDDQLRTNTDSPPVFLPRQNVILELGYFLGTLGRSKVCALYKHGTEIPSDYQGIVYVEMDDHGAWKNKIAQELLRADIELDLTGLV